MRSIFGRFAVRAGRVLGSPFAFLTALAGVLLWAVIGPSFKFSEQWQLAISTTTTIITFLSVFLIQSSQNRDFLAMQLKLDELLHAIKEARNDRINLEERPPDQLEDLAAEYGQKQSDPQERSSTATFSNRQEAAAPNAARAPRSEK